MMGNLRLWIRRLVSGSAVEFQPLSAWPALEKGGWEARGAAARLGVRTESLPPLEGFTDGPDVFVDPLVQEQLHALDRIPLARGRVLDFGCGSGIYRSILAKHTHTRDWYYHGADVSGPLIDSCRTKWPDSVFDVVAEEGPLPFQDKAYDVIFASGVLLCVKDPAALLLEFSRICAGGWVLLSRVPVRKFSPSRIYLQRIWHRWGRESHPVHIFNRDDLFTLIGQAGLHVEWSDHGVECYPLSGEPEPVHHMLFLLRCGDMTEQAP
jgi:SAM-dependent methyltransferase